MALVALIVGIALLLIVVGVLLSFTDVFLFLGIGAAMYWLGGLMLIIGVVLAIVLLVRGLLFERRRQSRGRRMT